MTDYSKLTVVKLKEELKARGLIVTGLKADLVARLNEDDAAPKVTEEVDEVGPEIAQDEAPAVALDEAVIKSAPEVEEAVPSDAPVTELSTQTQERAADPTKPGNVVMEEAQPDGGAGESSVPMEVENDQASKDNTETQPSEPPTSQQEPEAITEKAEPVVTIEKSQAQEVVQPEDTSAQVLPNPLTGVDTAPLPRTSTQTSVDREEVIEDSRKRKRRSKSPTPSTQDAALKKVKALDGSPRVKLQEDFRNGSAEPALASEKPSAGAGQIEDMDVDKPAGEGTQIGGEQKDDNNDIEGAELQQEQAHTTEESDDVEKAPEGDMPPPALDTPAAKLSQSSVKPSPTNAKFKELFTAPQSTSAQTHDTALSSHEDRDITPALHPASPALYIRNFMRPLQPAALKEHLHFLAKSSNEPVDSEVILEFFLDNIRTHCLVQFTTISAASRVRVALHERVWPDEKTRKALWADYIPVEKIKKWIDVEQDASGGRASQSKRWEVVYENENDEIAAYLQEADTAGSRGAVPGPRDGQQPPRKPSVVQAPAPVVPVAPRGDPGKGFKALDDLFKFTTAKPKLYFQPVSDAVAEKRRGRLAEGRGGGRSDEMRRFTFEDEEMVDKGPEFGAGYRGGYRGRGGPSRGYSSRGSYRGDSWGYGR